MYTVLSLSLEGCNGHKKPKAMDTLNKMYHRNVNERALGRGEKGGNPYSFLPLVQVHMYPDLQHIS